MVILTIEKEILKNQLSFKTFKEVPKLFYRIVKLYYELKGYEVGVLKDGEIK